MTLQRLRVAIGCSVMLAVTGCGASTEAGTATAAASASITTTPATSSESPVEQAPLEPGLEGFCQQYMLELSADAENKDVDELTRLVPDELSDAFAGYTGSDSNKAYKAYQEINTACAGQGPATVEMTIDGGADDGGKVTLDGGYCGTNAEGWVFTYLGDFTKDSTEKNAGQFLLEAPDAAPGVEADVTVNSAVNNVGLSNLTDYLGSTKDPAKITLDADGNGATFSFGQFELDPDPTPTVNGTLSCR